MPLPSQFDAEPFIKLAQAIYGELRFGLEPINVFEQTPATPDSGINGEFLYFLHDNYYNRPDAPTYVYSDPGTAGAHIFDVINFHTLYSPDVGDTLNDGTGTDRVFYDPVKIYDRMVKISDQAGMPVPSTARSDEMATWAQQIEFMAQLVQQSVVMSRFGEDTLNPLTDYPGYSGGEPKTHAVRWNPAVGTWKDFLYEPGEVARWDPITATGLWERDDHQKTLYDGSTITGHAERSSILADNTEIAITYTDPTELDHLGNPAQLNMDPRFFIDEDHYPDSVHNIGAGSLEFTDRHKDSYTEPIGESSSTTRAFYYYEWEVHADFEAFLFWLANLIELLEQSFIYKDATGNVIEPVYGSPIFTYGKNAMGRSYYTGISSEDIANARAQIANTDTSVRAFLDIPDELKRWWLNFFDDASSAPLMGGITEEDIAAAAAAAASAGTEGVYGLSDEGYEEALEEGIALGTCEDPAEPAPVKCEPPLCVENPTAIIPNWRNLDDEVFLNKRTCRYNASVNTGEMDASIIDDPAALESFLAEQAARGLDLILDHAGKSPVDPSTFEALLEDTNAENYFVDVRLLMPIKVLVTVPLELIDGMIFISDPEEEEEIPIGPSGVILESPQIRSMVRRVREGFRYYGIKYAVWAHETGELIDGFNPVIESTKLQMFVVALNKLLNYNGFKLTGKGSADKVELRFSEKYEVIFAQVHCGDMQYPLTWKKNGDELGAFKELDPINDIRTMAYVSKLVEMHTFVAAREPGEWSEFFTRFTYPEIEISDINLEEPIGTPELADGPLANAAQSIVNDIVSLPAALEAKFASQVCRDRAGQAIHDADVNDFGERLKRALHSKETTMTLGDDTFINLPEILSLVAESGNIHEFYSEVLDKLGTCGMLELLNAAMACLYKGLDLDEALEVIVKIVVSSLAGPALAILDAGLPEDKRQEIKAKIAEEFGELPMPWESGYNEGSYNYFVPSEDDDGNPVEAETIAEETAQYRIEATDSLAFGNSEQFGGGGTVGTAAANVMEAYLNAYKDALLEFIDTETLIAALMDLPGAEIIAKIFNNPACPVPPLFNPPLNEFMKTLELDFCRGEYGIKLPVLRKLSPIPDWYKMLMEALVEVLMSLAIKIIITLLQMILDILLGALCDILGLLGDLAAAVLGGGENEFAQSLDSILDDPLLSSALADEATINNAAGNLFASLGRACTDPADIPSSDEIADFVSNIGIVLTQGELVDLLNANASDEVIRVIKQVIKFQNTKFICIMPNKTAIEEFFKNLGSMLDPEFKTQAATAGRPIYPSLCGTPDNLEKINKLRCDLLSEKGLSSESCEKQIGDLKDQAISDLAALANIAQNGPFSNMPTIMDDPSNCDTPPGILPRDSDVPGGTNATQKLVVDSLFDVMESEFADDLVRRGGFLTMVLSDKEGRNLTAHNYHVFWRAMTSLGISGATHEELFPTTVSNYLKEGVWGNGVYGPGTSTHDPSGTQSFLQNSFTDNTSDPDAYDLTLGYANYYPKDHYKYYSFELNYQHSDHREDAEAYELNNRYQIGISEIFNYNFVADATADASTKTVYDASYVIKGEDEIPAEIVEYIEDTLGLDIELDITPPDRISPQAAVFGRYIEWILRNRAEASGPEADIDAITEICQTDMFEYINNEFFKKFAKTLRDPTNHAFYYGAGTFDGNTPTQFAPTKIDLDEGHTHPVTGVPIPLDPLAFGGNESHPAFYEQPNQNRPGWHGIAGKMIPEWDKCEPRRKHIIRFDAITDHIETLKNELPDDPRFDQDPFCRTEPPCSKLIPRATLAMISGYILATIRIYTTEVYLKSAATFLTFNGDFPEVYSDALSRFITKEFKDGFYQYSKKGFGKARNNEYWYRFLEMAVQLFGANVDGGRIEPTIDEIEAMDMINSLQKIWLKDTDPPSGKEYAGTGAILTKSQPPSFMMKAVAFFGASPNPSLALSEEDTLKEKEAKEIKEKAWDLFMQEIEPYAITILSRSVANEIEFISKEFSSRLPPKYRTMSQALLGDPYWMQGNLEFGESADPEDEPVVSGDTNPFNVWPDVTVLVAAGMLDAPSATSVTDPLGATHELPVSNAWVQSIYSGTYWPFALEKFISVTDYEVSDFANEDEADLASKYGTLISVSGVKVPEVWYNIVKNRNSNLYNVVNMEQFRNYLSDNSAAFGTLTRGDLWRKWSYGLRVIFVPNKNGTGSMPDLRENFSEVAKNITTSVAQDNKAFSIGTAYDLELNTFNVPLAKGLLDINMTLEANNTAWSTSYDYDGGFTALVQDLVCSPSYRMIFEYCFNLPRMASIMAIYTSRAFLPSIGASEDGSPDPANDGWEAKKDLANLGTLFSTFYGGGNEMSWFAIDYADWNQGKIFDRTKELASEMFGELYESADPTYMGDNDKDKERKANEDKREFNVKWPKFSWRLWQKEVGRPYDMNGDLCYNPEDE